MRADKAQCVARKFNKRFDNSIIRKKKNHKSFIDPPLGNDDVFFLRHFLPVKLPGVTWANKQ